MRPKRFVVRCFVAITLLGSIAIGTGCDPGVQATTENGIINASAAGLSAFLQAFFAVAVEAANNNANSNGN